MPGQRGVSGELAADSRRTSLRRLSSIASFSTIFGRRRSTNATDHTAASSSSNLSLTTTAVNNPDAGKSQNASTNSLQSEDTVPELQRPPTTHNARRSSYICLPDDPIGGMPRSRTFSNLPLPSRAKKSNPVIPSKSYSRLPSAFLSSTRLPSPQMSTRKYSHSRLPSMEPKPVKSRMRRSDTEPLLGFNSSRAHPPRSTAFKENISLSPIRQLPALDQDDFSLSLPEYSCRDSWDITTDVSEPFVPPHKLSSQTRSTQIHQSRLVATREHKSSPIHSNLRDRHPTPLQPFHRFNSQPILTASRQASQHGEVKPSRLLSVRQPPTPPPPKSAFASTQSRSTARKKKITTIPEARSSLLERTPLASRSVNRIQPPVLPATPTYQILHDPEPPAYWAGRLSALIDRYRNEELAHHLNPSADEQTPKSQTDKLHTPDAAASRICRAFAHLHTLCGNALVRESLVRFQCSYAEMVGVPEAKAIGLGFRDGEGGKSEKAKGKEGTAVGGGIDRVEDGGMGEARKASFMDRLLGRQKRRSLILA